MQLQRNNFKAALKGREPQAGSWNMTASASAAEAMGCVGLDFVIVDMEHTDAGLGDVSAILRALAATPTSAIVRLPNDDPITVRRLLDLGATTLMLPFIDTARQAAAVVNATRYPPEGGRGFALMHRAARYGQARDYLENINDEICLIAQIETNTALDNLEEIAAIDGIDGLFFGPGDLSAAIGKLGRTSDSAVKTLMTESSDRCHAAGKATGTLVGDTTAAYWAKSAGFDFISVASDLAMIVNGAASVVSTLRDDAGTDRLATNEAGMTHA